jgi:hypothetical protein
VGGLGGFGKAQGLEEPAFLPLPVGQSLHLGQEGAVLEGGSSLADPLHGFPKGPLPLLLTPFHLLQRGQLLPGAGPDLAALQNEPLPLLGQEVGPVGSLRGVGPEGQLGELLQAHLLPLKKLPSRLLLPLGHPKLQAGGAGVKKKHVFGANLELLPAFQGELQAVPLLLR